MARKADDELTKHTLNLYAGDMDKLKLYFPEVGASEVIRKIIRKFISQIEATQTQQPEVDIQL